MYEGPRPSLSCRSFAVAPKARGAVARNFELVVGCGPRILSLEMLGPIPGPRHGLELNRKDAIYYSLFSLLF